jgi:hypothetical protein
MMKVVEFLYWLQPLLWQDSYINCGIYTHCQVICIQATIQQPLLRTALWTVSPAIGEDIAPEEKFYVWSVPGLYNEGTPWRWDRISSLYTCELLEATKWEPSALGYNWATLPLGDINMGT